MLIQFSFLTSGLCEQCCSPLKDHEIVFIFSDNCLEAEYFNKNKESGDSVVSSMKLETENAETWNANLVSGWQLHVGFEPVKEDVYVIDSPSG
jgi:hypothetical protein